MRDFKYVKETAVKRRLVNVTCNKCGDQSTEEEYDNEKFSEFSASFGYGSKYDSERWGFDLCDDCLTDLVKTFKHVPDGFGEDSYYAEYPQTMFEKWKETGVVDLEAGMTAEEIEARGGSVYQDLTEEDEE